MTERRRAPRFAIEQLVELEYGKETFVRAKGVNISSSGLLCTVDTYVEPYTQVSLLISVPSGPEGRKISCEGTVMRSEKSKGKYYIGISFSFFSDDDAKALAEFIDAEAASNKPLEEEPES